MPAGNPITDLIINDLHTCMQTYNVGVWSKELPQVYCVYHILS